MSVLLAIDQGTTSSRAVVFDPVSFAVLGSAQQEIEQHYPRDGWVEHEPEDIWYSVARTVREALAKSGRDAASVAAQGRFDVILCRNVLIYFDEQSRLQASHNLFEALEPGGFVCLGHTESMARISDRFAMRRFDDAIVYQRPGP